jgi:hypothetical protein
MEQLGSAPGSKRSQSASSILVTPSKTNWEPAWPEQQYSEWRDHQPLIPVVGRLQQLVTLESVRIVNGSGACGEPVGQLVTGLAGNSDGVDLDDGHPPIVPDDSRQHHGTAGHDHAIGHHRALETGEISRRQTLTRRRRSFRRR